MKSLIALIGIVLFFVAASFPASTGGQVILGAYTMVMLSRPAEPGKPVAVINSSIEKQHSAYLEMISTSGTAVLVGEITGNEPLRSVLIFEGKTTPKIKELIDGDPAVKSAELKAQTFILYADENAFAISRAQKPLKPLTYYLGILRRGEKWADTSPETEALQKQHRDNIRKINESGNLVLWGLFGDGGDMMGIFVFKIDSLDAAKSLAATDPSVMAGRVVTDMYSISVPKGMLP